MTSGGDLALVLSGGNALGSFQAGAYQALHENGCEPTRVAGASAGAVNGAIICGNPRDRRVERLREMWRPAGTAPAPGAAEEARRTAAAAWTLAGGHPGLFVPRHLFGPWWNPLGSAEPASLYDAKPLADTLTRLVDFDLLNRGVPRFAATALDIVTGEDVVFDTRDRLLTAEHVRASSALLPAFAPVQLGGRLLGDAGMSANLPLDTVLADLPAQPLLCIAVDLLPLAGAPPRDLGETVLRMQDLVFAMQSRRTIAAWQAIMDARVRGGDTASVTLVHLSYADPAREVSGKAFDFSPESAAARWQAGQQAMAGALAALGDGRIATGAPGMAVHVASAENTWRQVRWSLAPVPG